MVKNYENDITRDDAWSGYMNDANGLLGDAVTHDLGQGLHARRIEYVGRQHDVLVGIRQRNPPI